MFNRIKNISSRLFSGKDAFGTAISRTKKSEAKLIKNYEYMDSAKKAYYTAFDDHFQNLITLDDFANFRGMQTIFKDIILKKTFKHGDVDRSNPLLFENYFINDTVSPTQFRKQHIIQQVRYVLKKYFALREHQFIQDIDANVGKHSAEITIISIGHTKNKCEIPYSNEKSFIINMSDMKTELKKIIKTTKKTMKNDDKYSVISNSSDTDTDKRNSVGKGSKRSNNSDNSGISSTHRTKRSRRTSKSNSGTVMASRFSIKNNSNSSVAGLQSTFSKASSKSESMKALSRFSPKKPKIPSVINKSPALGPNGLPISSAVSCYTLDPVTCAKYPAECYLNQYTNKCSPNTRQQQPTQFQLPGIQVPGQGMGQSPGQGMGQGMGQVPVQGMGQGPDVFAPAPNKNYTSNNTLSNS